MMANEYTFESFKNYVSNYVVGQENVVKLIYAGINAARRSKTIPAFLLRGPPGAGKTMITQIVAGYFNANYVFIQTTLNITEDELIYKFVPSEQTRSGVRIQYGPLPDALIKSREKITVLTIDEFDKTRPSADALLLDCRCVVIVHNNVLHVEIERNYWKPIKPYFVNVVVFGYCKNFVININE